MGEHYLDTVVVGGSIPPAPTINLSSIIQRRIKIATPRRTKPELDDKTNINEGIDAPEVRVIDQEGEQLGIIEISKAIALAAEKGLDLVEVSGKSKPPVCRIMDYGKFKYQIRKKQQDAKKKQAVIKIKEIKLRPKTEEHDFNFKLKHAMGFLSEGNKVKVTVQFRGREMAFVQLGMDLLTRFAEAASELGEMEATPKQEGRTARMILAPKK